MCQVTFKLENRRRLMRNNVSLRIAFLSSIKYSGSTGYVNKRCWKTQHCCIWNRKLIFFCPAKKKRKWGRCSLSFFLSNGRRKIGKKKKTNVNWKQEWSFANQCWGLYYKTALKTVPYQMRRMMYNGKPSSARWQYWSRMKDISFCFEKMHIINQNNSFSSGTSSAT